MPKITLVGKLVGVHAPVIGKYERDEITPSIEITKKLAKILDTTVGYLFDENDNADLFKDPRMLQRFQDISNLEDKDKKYLLTTVDHFIKASKISTIKNHLVKGGF